MEGPTSHSHAWRPESTGFTVFTKGKLAAFNLSKMAARQNCHSKYWTAPRRNCTSRFRVLTGAAATTMLSLTNYTVKMDYVPAGN